MSGLIWKQVNTTDGPDRRAAHSAVVYQDRMYIFGGWNGLHALDDVVAFSLTDHSWHSIDCTGELPNQRNNHAVAMVGNKMYVHGGHDGVVWLDDMFCLSLETFQWDKPKIASNSLIPKGRACHTLTKIKKKLYLFGGAEGQNIFDDLIEFDLVSNRWKELQPKGALPKCRNSHSMCEWNGKLILFGGHDGTNHLNDLLIYEADKYTWAQVAVKPTISCMRGHTAIVQGSYLHVFGGYSTSQLILDGTDRLNDFWSVDLENNTTCEWSLNKTDRQPPGRQKHSCVGLQDGRMVVYGGFDGDKWLKDINVLDLSSYELDRLEQFNQTSAVVNLHRKLFNNKVFSDFTFELEDGRTIPAHRANYFLNDMKEADSSRMLVKGTTYETFLKFLEFMYAGTVGCLGLQPDAFVGLLKLAEMYSIVGLKRKCEAELIRQLSISNCIENYLLAIRTGSRLLRRYSLNLLIRNIKHLFTTREYTMLEGNSVALAQVTRLVLINSELNLQYL